MERIEVTFFKYVGVGHGNPLQYSCLENSMNRGAWWATVTKSQTQLKWLSTLWVCRFPAKCRKFFRLEEFWILDTLAEKRLWRWFSRVLPELKPFGGVTSVSPGGIKKKKNHPLHSALGFPGGSGGKESAFSARAIADMGSISGSGSSPGEGNGNPPQYSCLVNSKGGGAWRATVTKSQTLLSDWTELNRR